MGKLDELRRTAGANVKDSTGAERAAAPATVGVAGGPPTRWQGVTRSKDALSIPVAMIIRDEAQPREEFDEEALARLAESLKGRGQLQPIRVRWDEGRGAYVILVGERRWRAAQRAGLAELQAIVMEGELPAEERLMIQLVENALREDLRPVEQARSYRRLMEAKGWSTRDLAAELHIGQASVVRALALLDLPDAVQNHVEQGALAASVAAELTKLPDAQAQAEVSQAVIRQQLTRDEVAEVIKAVRARRPAPAPRPDPVAIDLGDGTVVTIKWKKANGVAPLQALRRATRQIQDQGRDEQAA